MWDIKLEEAHFFNEAIEKRIIGTMWDIKANIQRVAVIAKALYYLNHVGYKVSNRIVCANNPQNWYYLNHVGYKEPILTNATNTADIGIIGTMWDIKRRKFIALGKSQYKYYLNHVGYKELSLLHVFFKKLLVLSEPCGI